MNASQILKELSPLGKESYKRTLMKNHGVKEPCYGVAISELQKIRKRIKKDYQLAKDLYDTGNYDAMYLAGLIADDSRMTQADLQHWVEQAYGGGLYGTTVPSVAAGSPHGHAMALRWIESNAPLITAAGWATLSAIVSITPDDQLDLDELRSLLERVEREIHQAPDLPRYQMNQFVIAVGSFVAPLKDIALRHAEAIGPVTADLGNNQCQVFSAPDYIRKVEERGATGKKRKSAKC
ncbi:DNA alkylation repair protein [Verrucomicrobium sp. BvORR106]|uniref:DNA alkylation repair protein n=1 Tax=Verrucomicrobium sp. BvORR106 TaxID=1403819 RepID=UPI00056DE56E|nr:DNA alkylation repair protein [Verrucomicrobium sp. BvORR106]